MGEWSTKQQKRCKGVENKTRFDDLADELRVDIFRRLDIKDRGKFKCVSKAWRYLITISCFPIFSGFLYMCEDINRPRGKIFFMSYKPSQGYLRSHGNFALDSLNLPFQLTRELQESCNGLLLLCHGDILYKDAYNYYVVNPLTKQYAVIPKPKPYSGSYKYAALAYHPAESSHFKIVRFRVKNLDVYSSETRKWSSSRIQLSDHATRAKWIKQSVYLKSAIYRLSMSGHVLKFDVNMKKATKTPLVVQEIEISEMGKINEAAACIGLCNGQVNFAISDGSSLKIWELNHKSIDSGYFQGCWSLKFSCSCHEICPCYEINRSYRSYIPLTFHPHLDVVFLGCVGKKFTSFSCLDYSETKVSKTWPLSISHWGKAHDFLFPLFQCEAPFASY